MVELADRPKVTTARGSENNESNGYGVSSVTLIAGVSKDFPGVKHAVHIVTSDNNLASKIKTAIGTFRERGNADNGMSPDRVQHEPSDQGSQSAKGMVLGLPQVGVLLTHRPAGEGQPGSARIEIQSVRPLDEKQINTVFAALQQDLGIEVLPDPQKVLDAIGTRQAASQR